jgi:hypothetical protein
VLILKDSEVAKADMEQLRSRMMLQSVDPLFRDRNLLVAERKGRYRGFSLRKRARVPLTVISISNRQHSFAIDFELKYMQQVRDTWYLNHTNPYNISNPLKFLVQAIQIPILK